MPSNIKKITIIPPLKGLNLHDNPIVMSPEYASKLVNFMPPYSFFRVRPALKKVAEIEGTVRGIYAYNIGATTTYAEKWFDSTFETAAMKQLLIKVSRATGKGQLISLNAGDNSTKIIAEMNVENSDSDYSIFEQAIYFCDGSRKGLPYIYSPSYGLKRVVMRDPNDDEIPALENMCVYRGWGFASAPGTMMIYFAEKDTLNPNTNKSAWDAFWEFFSPTAGGYIDITGTAKLGGEIIKIFTMPAPGQVDLDQFLCVLTSAGELVLYSGTDPTKAATWKVAGVYRVPVPLNRNCVCEMEGDVVMATENGFISLQRVVRGSTALTEALEHRLSELFTRYEFRSDAMRQFMFLRYFAKKRLLIFNVPSSSYGELAVVEVGYIIRKATSKILLNTEFEDKPADLGGLSYAYHYLIMFMRAYIFGLATNYQAEVQFNGSSNTDGRHYGFKINFNTIFSGVVDGIQLEGNNAACEVTFKFLIYEGGSIDTSINLLNDAKLNFLVEDYRHPHYNEPPYEDNIFPPASDFKWNQNLKKQDGHGNNVYVLDPAAISAIRDDELEVTNIVCAATEPSGKPQGQSDTILDLAGPRELPYENKAVYKFAQSGDMGFGSAGSSMPSGITNIKNLFEQFLWADAPPAGEATKPYCYLPHILAKIKSQHPNPIEATNWPHTATVTLTNNLVFQDEVVTSNPVTSIMAAHTFEFLEQPAVGGIKINRHVTYTLSVSRRRGTITTLMGSLAARGVYTAATQYAPFPAYPEWDTLAVDKWPANAADEWEFDVKGWRRVSNTATLTSSSSGTAADIEGAIRGEMPQMDYDQPPSTITPNTNWDLTVGYIYRVWPNSSGIEVDLYSDKTNHDLSIVPLINGVSISAPYQAVQYVLDSHYGTWSMWQGINMVAAAENDQNFYMIITPPTSQFSASGSQITENHSIVAVFSDTSIGGDFEGDAALAAPIHTEWMSAAMDFAVPAYKKFIYAKILATESCFWQSQDSLTSPLQILVDLDFVRQPAVYYQHATDGVGEILRALKAKYPKIAAIKKYHEIEKIDWALWRRAGRQIVLAAENVRSQRIEFAMPAANRITVGMQQEVTEPNIILYGFELFFVVQDHHI